MNRRGAAKVVFVTGTDTGVGKTVLTALLLSHLRGQGINALAVKPFASGGRDDALLLQSISGDGITLDDVNPFHFKMPVAPLIAAREEGVNVRRSEVIGWLRRMRGKCDVLLVEGAGGLLTPLGEQYDLLNLANDFNPSVILVAPNRLGVLSQTRAAMQCLQAASVKKKSVVLTPLGIRRNDVSILTNCAVLTELLQKTSIFEFPRMGSKNRAADKIGASAKKIKKLLAEIWESL